MDLSAYFESLSDELATLKDRIRLLIQDAHWPTDGEWKESVLRSILRRSTPQSVTVGRGFVVEHDWCSSQIDVLLYDNTLPILYKDGDLVFVTPSACRAIVEVKTSVNARQFRDAAEKLALNAALIRGSAIGLPLFVGLFAYGAAGRSNRLLQTLREVANGNAQRVVNHAALGHSTFIKYWQHPPEGGTTNYAQWHLYRLARTAPGYFVHNILAESARGLAARHENAWWPQQGKEVRLEQRMALVDA